MLYGIALMRSTSFSDEAWLVWVATSCMLAGLVMQARWIRSLRRQRSVSGPPAR